MLSIRAHNLTRGSVRHKNFRVDRLRAPVGLIGTQNRKNAKCPPDRAATRTALCIRAPDWAGCQRPGHRAVRRENCKKKQTAATERDITCRLHSKNPLALLLQHSDSSAAIRPTGTLLPNWLAAPRHNEARTRPTESARSSARQKRAGCNQLNLRFLRAPHRERRFLQKILSAAEQTAPYEPPHLRKQLIECESRPLAPVRRQLPRTLTREKTSQSPARQWSAASGWPLRPRQAQMIWTHH